MHKAIFVGLAILTISTTAASAATHRTHQSRATTPKASAAAISPTPSSRAMNANARSMNANASIGTPRPMMGGTAKDHEAYMKNLHDSGYDPKKDFTPSGTMRQQ